MDGIKKDGLYRRMRLGTVAGAHIVIGGKRYLNLCSNDYLGIPPQRVAAGQMQSSSRLVSGNDASYYYLEKKLARHKSQQASLVYPTGYMANLGAISSIVRGGDLVLSDSLNHASIIEACRLSGAKISVYRHNDMDDLGAKLAQRRQRKFIITEGVFSMDGDFADLRRIAELARQAGAILVLDDAHGDFAVGRDGRGTASHLGVARQIDVYISSLSKALGSFGGYVASSRDAIEFCTNKSKAFIYTSALPSLLIRHASKRFDHDREKKRRALAANVRRVSGGLRKLGYEISSKTHIIPVVIGDEKRAVDFGGELLKNGVFAQPIRYPTVPRGTARIRLSVTAWLGPDNIECALGAFESAGKKFRII